MASHPSVHPMDSAVLQDIGGWSGGEEGGRQQGQGDPLPPEARGEVASRPSAHPMASAVLQDIGQVVRRAVGSVLATTLLKTWELGGHPVSLTIYPSNKFIYS